LSFAVKLADAADQPRGDDESETGKRSDETKDERKRSGETYLIR
jgi:hypothetical protein